MTLWIKIPENWDLDQSFFEVYEGFFDPRKKKISSEIGFCIWKIRFFKFNQFYFFEFN